MNTSLYLLTPQSNLHVGAGNSGYGVIDNLVQRDHVDQYPIINASSLKGALREYLEEKLGKREESKTIFGNSNAGKGKSIFSDAHLLSLPVRSSSAPYFIATAPYVLEKFLSLTEEYRYKLPEGLAGEIREATKLKPEDGKPVLLGKELPKLKIEDFDTFNFNTAVKTDHLNKLICEDANTGIVLFSNNDFQYQCSDNALPVLARNQLDNGKSSNLWYEQIVPRLSRFYFFVEEFRSNIFADNFGKENSRVQVGGNATVGYGYCKISNLSSKDQPHEVNQ